MGEDLRSAIRAAFRDITVEGPNGPRSLGYYASVGIDHFNHDTTPGLDLCEQLISRVVDRIVDAVEKRPA